MFSKQGQGKNKQMFVVKILSFPFSESYIITPIYRIIIWNLLYGMIMLKFLRGRHIVYLLYYRLYTTISGIEADGPDVDVSWDKRARGKYILNQVKQRKIIRVN